MMKKKILMLLVVLSAVISIVSLTGRIGVKAAVAKLNKTELNLDVEERYKLKVKNTKKTVKCKSDNSAVARVTKKGNVYGVSEGECIITAKVGKKTLTCKVVVKDSVLETLDAKVEIKNVEIPINSKWKFAGIVKADDLYQFSISEDEFKWVCAQVAELSEGESEMMTASDENFMDACQFVADSLMQEFETKDAVSEVVKVGDNYLGKVSGICQSNGNDIPIIVYIKITDNKLVFVMGMEIGEADADMDRLVRTVCMAAEPRE